MPLPRPRRTRGTLALALVLLATLPALAHAQRGGRKAPEAPEQASFSNNTLPTAKVVKERANVAAMLFERRKKLGLDDAVGDSLKALAGTIDARNTATLDSYEELRAKVRADQNSGASETLEGRARVAMAGTAIQDLGKTREADAAAALALIPADKQGAAKKVIEEQDEDFAKLSGGRRGGGGRRP
jgi:hypothetical protein